MVIVIQHWIKKKQIPAGSSVDYKLLPISKVNIQNFFWKKSIMKSLQIDLMVAS